MHGTGCAFLLAKGILYFCDNWNGRWRQTAFSSDLLINLELHLKVIVLDFVLSRCIACRKLDSSSVHFSGCSGANVSGCESCCQND